MTEHAHIKALKRRYFWLQKILIQNSKRRDLGQANYARTVAEVKALDWAITSLTGEKPGQLETVDPEHTMFKKEPNPTQE